MIWYFSPDGIQRHEASDEDLEVLAREGRLTGEMLLWREGMSEWRPAREVRADLWGEGISAPPPPPPPPPSASFPPTGTTPSFQPMVPKRPTDPGALMSLISGIVGLVGGTTGFCCCVGFLVAPIAGLVAVIFGHQVYSKSEGHPEAEGDRNLALMGLVFGYVTLLLTIGGIVWNLIFVGIAGMAAALDGVKTGPFSP